MTATNMTRQGAGEAAALSEVPRAVAPLTGHYVQFHEGEWVPRSVAPGCRIEPNREGAPA